MIKSLTAPGLGLALVLGLASGCGGSPSTSAAAATPAASPTASATGGPRFFGAAGLLTRVSASTLTIDSARGVRTVTISASTRILRVQSGTVADIATGDCVVAAGSTNSIGTVTATVLSVTPAGPSGCTRGSFGQVGVRLRVSASPGSSGRPRRGGGFFAGARFGGRPPAAYGSVASVSGSTLEVQNTSGQTTVDATASTHILVTEPAAASALAVGECVTAAGTTNAAGVIAATTVTITPAGPTGCLRPRASAGSPAG